MEEESMRGVKSTTEAQFIVVDLNLEPDGQEAASGFILVGQDGGDRALKRKSLSSGVPIAGLESTSNAVYPQNLAEMHCTDAVSGIWKRCPENYCSNAEAREFPENTVEMQNLLGVQKVTVEVKRTVT
ncbi:hypothetical protein AXF42_Ash021581 [Apostasia shenzhenica]|uniref:Uncharacterized protein n=1 Tax=Apostasia shenzhenica TaxID=1088818 RepID=A0A2H9ZSV2_9ASPA|nr:hypothetical protein AXF42_Ash021581 [Apostasia shenzhenica]